MAEKAILTDLSKCMGCRGCQVACKQWNDLPAEATTNRGSYENPPDLSYHTWTRLTFHEMEREGELAWLFRRHQCLHCTDAACVHVCPTGALYKDPLGFTGLDPVKCNGCGYCVQFCPFSIPRLGVMNTLTGEAKASKCTFCADRVVNGEIPACAKTCPAGAMEYGDRDELVARGSARVAELRAKGYDDAYLYGRWELGGLHQMYILQERPSAYGLPENPQFPTLASVWQEIIQPLGVLSLGAAGVGLLINFLVARKMKEGS